MEEGSSSIDDAGPSSCTRVNLSRSRNFSTIFISSLKETLFPDDPFSQFQEQTPLNKFISTLKYYVPMLEWLPNYSLKLFKFDLLSGITIASLAIPQGISYAKLADLPPIIGLCTSIFGLYISMINMSLMRLHILYYYCLIFIYKTLKVNSK